MPSLRDIKRTARRRLHDAMKVAVLYISPAAGAEPVLLHVRVHTKWAGTGASGASDDSPERQEVTPKILFMLDELADQGVTPLKGAIISVERGEAYALDNAEAPDLISVKWIVSQIQSPVKLASLPVPEATHV